MKEKKKQSTLARRINRKKSQEAFLQAFAKLGNITAACVAAGIGRKTHYVWLEEDAEYRKAVADAEQEATEVLEKEAFRRAVVGVDKPVHYGGKRIDKVREYSDILLIFLLKARRPEKYRDTFVPVGPLAAANLTIYLPSNARDSEPEPPKMLPARQEETEET